MIEWIFKFNFLNTVIILSYIIYLLNLKILKIVISTIVISYIIIMIFLDNINVPFIINSNLCYNIIYYGDHIIYILLQETIICIILIYNMEKIENKILLNIFINLIIVMNFNLYIIENI